MKVYGKWKYEYSGTSMFKGKGVPLDQPLMHKYVVYTVYGQD